MPAYRKPKLRCHATGKRPFPDELAASCMADSISRKHKTTLYIYKCPWCGNWHLTKRPPKSSATLKESYGR